MKRITLLLIAFVVVVGISANITIVKNGKAAGKIIYSDQRSEYFTAAKLLQDFIKRVSGAEVPVTSEFKKAKKGDIVIGYGDSEGLTDDAFIIKTDDKGMISILSGGGKGSVYGAVTLLEKYLGVNCYGANEYDYKHLSDIVLPAINITETPAFHYRQTQNYGLRNDSVYRLWMRLEEPRDVFADGLWVHTFDHLLPSAVYGKEHPEYYSFITGQRRPGRASQWCLTNPEVFEIAAARIDSIFEANPGMDVISVSQNDGNNTYCVCDECKAVIEREGSPSGLFIEFLNKLAARRPDKQFSTLAYLFTMHAPKHIKPLPNVNIMLCSIDSKREVPLTDNESGRDFMKALTDWSKISNNIFVWDYGINFDGYLAPFPNFPVLQKNMQLFRDNNVKMHFSQISSSRGGDFAEMRTYMASKLMWNPDLNADSLMRSFMTGYYGDAAPYIYEYEKLLEGALLASGLPLWIYDSPVTHKDGMLNANLRKRYNELFDKAEMSVANDSVRLARVQRQRLSLQFPELEIARAEGWATPETMGAKLDLFEKRVKQFDVPTINERSNSPLDYVKLYRERYMSPKGVNKAKGATVQWVVEPANKYKELGETALTDEIFGGAGYVESWVGWEGTDGSFILDMHEPKKFSKISADFLHQLGAWVLLPERVEYSVSNNGKDFVPFGEVYQPEDRSVQVMFKQLTSESEEPVEARYVKVYVTGVKTCPSWHYGVGQPAWFFVDEITVE